MPISPKQERIFHFISGYISSNNQPPTMAEIGRQFQMKSSASVSANLAVLEREGFIKRIPNVARGIQIVESNGQNTSHS